MCEPRADPRTSCLIECENQGFVLCFDPQGSNNRCFYSCIAKTLGINLLDVIKSLESFMLENQFLPVFDEVSCQEKLY